MKFGIENFHKLAVSHEKIDQNMCINVAFEKKNSSKFQSFNAMKYFNRFFLKLFNEFSFFSRIILKFKSNTSKKCLPEKLTCIIKVQKESTILKFKV